MEKIVKIDGIDVPMKANASTLAIYKAEFKRDYMSDFAAFGENPDFDCLMSMAWAYAKTAKSDTMPYTEWLSQFSLYAFTGEVINEIMKLSNANSRIDPKNE